MRKALTLYEAVAALLVFAVAIPSLFNMFAHLAKSTYQDELITTATYVSSCFLEEIRSKNFDENVEAPWTQHSQLGPDSGESSRADFDDVDDYDGFSGNYTQDPSYQVDIVIFYVDPSDLNTQVTTRGDYKHIKITISRAPDITIETQTLVSALEFL